MSKTRMADPALQPATPYIYRPYSYSRNYLPEENFRPMAARFPESGDPFATRRAFETPSVTQPRPNRKNASYFVPAEAERSPTMNSPARPPGR